MSNRGAALGIAVGGVLLGHWATYALVSPSLGARRALLARTGHAYLGMADQLALAVTLLAFGAVFLGRLTRPGEGQPRTLELVTRLASFQVAAFLAMEVAERISAGSPLGELFHGPLLGIGILAQVAVAAGGALAIRWLLRAADLATTFAGTHIPLPRPAFTTLTLPVPVAVAGVAVANVRGRGPPQLP
jgi:hypothetical protein